MAKILIVDDDVDVRRMLRILLDSAGHAVVEATSAREALALCEFDEPDLVVLDQMMPGTTGLEVLPHLRAAAPQMKVVMYSAITRSLDQAPGERADAYVDKGDVEGLLREVDLALQDD